MKLIAGIQQVGIGLADIDSAWAWYRKHFGMNVPVFEDAAEASLMLNYTGGRIYKRKAVLALNLKGGGGFELWQFTNRTPQAAAFTVKIGDLGINAVKIKCSSIEVYYAYGKQAGLQVVSPIVDKAFYLKDPQGNYFQLKESTEWFSESKALSGGVYGAVIGVSNLQKSAAFYCNNLGYEQVGSTKNYVLEGVNYESILLQHNNEQCGAFSKLLGNTELELVQRSDMPGRKIYADRFWGDLGFIHLCFDVNNMVKLKELFNSNGHTFTVDSADSFNMGEAAGRFAYVEDPDGTLIELVETHKIPILKKFGIYLNLKEKHKTRALPNWQVKLLGLARKKD